METKVIVKATISWLSPGFSIYVSAIYMVHALNANTALEDYLGGGGEGGSFERKKSEGWNE